MARYHILLLLLNLAFRMSVLVRVLKIAIKHVPIGHFFLERFKFRIELVKSLFDKVVILL